MAKQVRERCACCGQTLKVKAARVVEMPVNTAALTDEQFYAHCKRTAPVEDLKFFLRVATLSPELRADVEALLAQAPTLKRADVYRQYVALQDRWRRESNERERAERAALPAAA